MRDLLIFAALVYGGYALTNGQLPLPGTPAVVSPTVSAAAQAAVGPLIGLVSNPASKRELGQIYRDWADALERDGKTTDGGVIKSVSGFQAGTKRYGRLAVQKTPYASDWNATQEEMQKCVLAYVGDNDAALSGASRDKLVEILRGISWAIEQ